MAPWIVAVAAAAMLAAAAAARAQSASSAERPMYGGGARTAEQAAADKAFVESAIASGYTRRSGALEAARRGFEQIRRRDFATAIKRFNQSWLLDPELAHAYHGFALVLAERDRDPAGAEAMFKRAADLSDVSAGALGDYGRLLVASKRAGEALAILERAGAMRDDPDHVGARRILADAYYDLRQFDRACPIARAIVDGLEGGERRQMEFILASERCK